MAFFCRRQTTLLSVSEGVNRLGGLYFVFWDKTPLETLNSPSSYIFLHFPYVIWHLFSRQSVVLLSRNQFLRFEDVGSLWFEQRGLWGLRNRRRGASLLASTRRCTRAGWSRFQPLCKAKVAQARQGQQTAISQYYAHAFSQFLLGKKAFGVVMVAF